MSSFGIVDDSACVEAGMDPAAVDRVIRRFVHVCRAAERLGLDLSTDTIAVCAIQDVKDSRASWSPVLSRIYTGVASKSSTTPQLKPGV